MSGTVFMILVLLLAADAWVLAMEQTDVCGGAQSQLGDKCFHFIETKLTWPEAKAYCKAEYGGILAQPTTKENEEIKTYLTNLTNKCANKALFWLGVFGVEESRTHVYAVTGSVIQFSDWSRGNPSWSPSMVDGSLETCVEYRCVAGKIKWNDKTCSSPSAFVCETRATSAANSTAGDISSSTSERVIESQTNDTITDLSGCGEAQLRVANKCFHFNDYGRTWEEAKVTCQEVYGGMLAQPDTAENKAIKDYVMGVTDQCQNMRSYWFGMNQNSNTSWIFAAGDDPPTFLDWHPDEPSYYDNNRNPEGCVEYQCLAYRGSIAWNDRSCEHQVSFICENTVSTPAPTPATTPAPQSVPDAGEGGATSQNNSSDLHNGQTLNGTTNMKSESNQLEALRPAAAVGVGCVSLLWMHRML
ncbi:macrophage mannose receptor 1-like isoform X1 [Haliotis rufescens]|uniref:macrophage mannose receptor 1-like isoform X1 n=1 Tax=Haliotis rufescens TaxID=6454 RepID=UPI00201F018E|nr:macrophage mannose receptor 1-like isoform X1 [Haliotis rufescens]